MGHDEDRDDDAEERDDREGETARQVADGNVHGRRAGRVRTNGVLQ